MDITFLNSNKPSEDQPIDVQEVSDYANKVADVPQEPSEADIAEDLANSFRRRRDKKVAEPAKDQPAKEEPPLVRSETEIESMRVIVRLYLNFWPNKFPGYTHARIDAMNYDQLVETRMIFDIAMSSGANVESFAEIFYKIIEAIEHGICLSGINLSGFAECCKSTKEIDSDIKLIAIQLVSSRNIPPHLRLALNLVKTAGIVYSFHTNQAMKDQNK